MFEKLKNLIQIGNSDGSEDISPKEMDSQLTLATCVLLLEMASTDDNFSMSEATRIKEILSENYGLSKEEISALIEEAANKRAESTDLYEFTSILNQNLKHEAKMKLIKSIWDVIYADGVVDQYEDHLVHRLSDLLHIEHEDMIEAKLEAKPEGYKGR